jgi:hypothetical protein
MKVMFGKPGCQQTLGEIVKLNPTRAKVKALQARGHGRGGVVGAVWDVPYGLITRAVDLLDEMTPPHEESQRVLEAIVDTPISYYEFSDKNIIMEAIVDTYNRLSPEWLTCDGELSRTQVNARAKELNRRLKGLFIAMGRDVSESAALKWYEEKRNSKQEQV